MALLADDDVVMHHDAIAIKTRHIRGVLVQNVLWGNAGGNRSRKRAKRLWGAASGPLYHPSELARLSLAASQASASSSWSSVLRALP